MFQKASTPFPNRHRVEIKPSLTVFVLHPFGTRQDDPNPHRQRLRYPPPYSILKRFGLFRFAQSTIWKPTDWHPRHRHRLTQQRSRNFPKRAYSAAQTRNTSTVLSVVRKGHVIQWLLLPPQRAGASSVLPRPYWRTTPPLPGLCACEARWSSPKE